MKKKIISILLTIVMLIGIIPLGAISAFAEGKGSINITDGCDVDKLYGTYFTGDYDDSVFKITGVPTSNVNFNNITFENITCDENGACVYIDVDDETIGISTDFIFTNCRFINCSTTENGGVVYINNTTRAWQNYVFFVNCTFINCHADGDGGALYINGTEAVVQGKNNTFFSGCSAGGNGGALYINGTNAKVHGNGFSGNGNTVISDCSAGGSGGGIYMNYGKELDGFFLADNTATGDGGGICNTANGATISNCRLYRNTCGSKGGGLYTDNATVNNCKFFENDCSDDGYELSTNSSSTQINNCTFTSNYSGDNVVYGGMQSNCTFPDKSSYQLTVGNGSQGNPYIIKSTDDWDAFHYMVYSHFRTEYSDGRLSEFGIDAFKGKYVRLDSDITVCNTIGETYTNNQAGYTSKHEFTGTFDGNGHTIAYVYCSDDNADDEKAAFGYANGATVKNLTVNGYIKGSWGIGGIFGHAENSTAENCTNNAVIENPALYTGGIAGYSVNTQFINCTNNGKISGSQEQVGGIAGYAEGGTINGCVNNGEVTTGYQKAGGIVGYAEGGTINGCANNGDVITGYQKAGGIVGEANRGVKILNCINHASVTAAYYYAGGLIGYEDGKVTAQNSINTGKVTAVIPAWQYPAEGDYVIYTASDNTKCLDISAVSMEEYGNLNIWTAANSGAKVFTLKYYDKYDAYAIIAKHSGLALTAEPKSDYSAVDGVNVYQFTSQRLRYQLWTFEGSGNNCKIRSLESGFTMNISGGTASDGANVIAYKYQGNDLFSLVPEPNQVLKSVYANGITGKHYGGSTYEQCYYDKDKAVGDHFGIGLSYNALFGLSTDTVDGKEYLMPYCVNDFIKENNKSKDGWLRAAFDENGFLRFISDAAAMYMGTDGLHHYVENAKEVTASMETLGENEKSTAYYVNGTVIRDGRIQILGNVTLVLNDDCYYDVQGGIGLEEGNSLTVCSYSLGEHMGSMTAATNQENKGAAAIGGNAAKIEESLSLDDKLSVSSEKHDCGDFTVYGGNIEAIAYSENDMYGVGIGGNSLSMWHSYINVGVKKPIDFKTGEETFNGGDGGNVKVYNGNLSVKATGAVGIGGGNGTYFYVKESQSVKTDKNFSGGNGGTFSFYGGTVTVESDVAAFGKGRNGDGNRDAVTDPNMTAFTSTKDGVYGALAGDNLSELKKAYNFDDEAFRLNGEKCVQFGKYGHRYTEALNPTCETAGHKAYLLRTVDNLYYEEGGFNVAIGDYSALQAWISEGGDGYFAPLGHIWVYVNENQHKCIRCENTESHTMGDDGCTKCNGFYFYYDYSIESHTFEKKAIPSGTKLLPDFDGNYTLPGGWYLVHGDVTAAERITCTGDVHLILENGCNFIANEGIALATDVSLSVYARSFDAEEMGKLTVTNSPQYCAGIGSNQKITCGNISIHGGVITAIGFNFAAGIGSGWSGSCGNISVYGGVITAQGGEEAAGIGSGNGGSCGNISVYGGVITATGGSYAAGIGSGDHGSCGNISVYGGVITATGSSYAAGIGSGDGGSCSNISICGGDITATGGEEAAGIGSGTRGTCESVAISDYLDITAGAEKDSAQPVPAYNGEKYVHTELNTARKAPTCTQNGHIEFFTNEGKYYSDTACTKEITDLALWLKTPETDGGGMLPALGHSWKCENGALHKCERCNAEEKHTDDGTGICEICSGTITHIISAKNGAVISNGLIYGLEPRLESLESYIEVPDGLTLEYDSPVGTGTVVKAIKDSEVCESLTVVIFGDVNSDGIYDGMDAVVVNCVANGLLSREQVGEAVYMAADCNHDGAIDSLDVDILQQAGVLLASVDQSKTQEELQTNSAYVEYLNLIDQNPVNEETQPEQTPSALEKLIGFIADIFTFLNNLINFIKTVFV